MKLEFKKIIAKEFLYFIVIIVLTLLTYFSTFAYNFFKSEQIDKTTTTIFEKNKMKDSLYLSYSSKIKNKKWFFEKFASEFNATEEDNSWKKEIWNRLEYLAKKDSIKQKWLTWDNDLIEFHKKIGQNTAKELTNFVTNNTLSASDIKNQKKVAKINDEINYLEKSKKVKSIQILSDNEKIDFGIKSLLVFIFILVILRHLIASINWSLKTLKK